MHKTPSGFTAESVQSRLSHHYVHHGQATIVATTFIPGYENLQYISPTGMRTHSKIIAKRWAEQVDALMKRGAR